VIVRNAQTDFSAPACKANVRCSGTASRQPGPSPGPVRRAPVRGDPGDVRTRRALLWEEREAQEWDKADQAWSQRRRVDALMSTSSRAKTTSRWAARQQRIERPGPPRGRYNRQAAPGDRASFRGWTREPRTRLVDLDSRRRASGDKPHAARFSSSITRSHLDSSTRPHPTLLITSLGRSAVLRSRRIRNYRSRAGCSARFILSKYSCTFGGSPCRSEYLDRISPIKAYLPVRWRRRRIPRPVVRLAHRARPLFSMS